MASDTGIFKDRDGTMEEEAPKHGARKTDLSLFLRGRQESEDKPPVDKPKEAEETNKPSDDPGLLPGIGLLAIPGVGPLLAAAAMVTHKQDVTEKEKSDKLSEDASPTTEENVQHKSKRED